MDKELILISITAVLFVLSFATGGRLAWISSRGKMPYSILMVTLHKLLSLATAVLTGVTFYILINK